jgi:hypothetical protein
MTRIYASSFQENPRGSRHRRREVLIRIIAVKPTYRVGGSLKKVEASGKLSMT